MDITRVLEALPALLTSPRFWEHQARLTRTLALVERLSAPTDRLARTLARLRVDR